MLGNINLRVLFSARQIPGKTNLAGHSRLSLAGVLFSPLQAEHVFYMR